MTEAEQRQASDVGLLTQIVCTAIYGLVQWDDRIAPMVLAYMAEDVEL